MHNALRMLSALCLTLFLLAGCDSDGGGGDSNTCKTGCENILACRASGYADSDLQNGPEFASQEACEALCAQYASTEGAACAARTKDCADLDDVCDVY